MTWLFDFVVPILGNLAMFFLGAYWQRATYRRKQRQVCPYQWRCPRRDCGFECGSNDVMITDYLATNHQQEHVREGM